MQDIKKIRENLAEYKKAAKDKNIKLDFDLLIKLDDQRKELIQEAEVFRSQKNEASKKIPNLNEKDRRKLLKKMKDIDVKQDKIETELKKIQPEFNDLMLHVPMIPAPDVPIGKDDSESIEIYKWGELPQFDFKIKDHVDLGQELDIIDIERGVKIAGSRSYVLKGDGARLEAALLKYAQDFITGKGYELMLVPVLVEETNFTGTGWFPEGKDQVYEIEEDNKFLIGTSEVSLGGYHADEILRNEELPKRYSGTSVCFRREAGTYGKDTHGLYRVHQFNKIEQFIICQGENEVSEALFQELKINVEEFLKSLELPYRILNVCTGDMGKGKYKMFDLECWMPSRNSYGETHSCSNLHDFQARRLNIRYKDKNGKTQFCHTLNNTVVATPRILIPLLENNQNKDGSINIPKVLRPYMNNQDKIIAK
jgi:seryl-tRNA synthetase